MGDGDSRLAGRIGEDWYATHVAVRLDEFFFATTPWHRRLWDAGTVSALRELLQAAHWMSDRVLSESAVRWFARELEPTVGMDRGVGDRQMRKVVVETLGSGVRYDSRHWRRLEQLVIRVENGYLQRWEQAVEDPQPPGPERVARAVAAHLLDRGYSLTYLHRWVSKHIASAARLRELFADAGALEALDDRSFEVVVPFEAMPTRNVHAQANWLAPSAVKSWLESRGGLRPGATPVRQAGGFTYTIRAKDAPAAADRAAGILDRLLARAGYAAGYAGIRPCQVVWVHDLGPPTASGGVPAHPLGPTHRGTYVRSLVKEHKLHDVGVDATTLDDALELAASLNSSSSPGPALASGWSALEALLFAPADPQDHKDGRGVVVCDRAASLVACSWPRAELTRLSYAHTAAALPSGPVPRLIGDRATALDALRGGPPSGAAAAALRTAIDVAEDHRARCRTILAAFTDGERLVVDDPRDAAAQERMLALATAPRKTLGDIHRSLQDTFRRMYRQRNIVLHGGAASSESLAVALRTSAPLVGATLDRVCHAQLVNRVSPVALAARADLHLGLVGSPGAPGLADLLE